MTSSTGASSCPSAVLFDRDGTLVVDVPHNGDPGLVRLVPGAEEAVAAVRAAGVATGVVTNQAAVGRGLITRDQVSEVAARVDELLGAFGTWAVCPHVAEDGCGCRKPAPGLVLQAAEALGVEPERCVVIGDIGADVGAARAAGALGVLVPTPVTLRAEIDDADVVAGDLREAVELALAHLARLAPGSPAAPQRAAEPAAEHRAAPVVGAAS